MNTNFLIDERELENAKSFCLTRFEGHVYNRVIASNLAAIIAEKYFAESSIDIDISTGLRNICNFAKEYEIADIYVNGNYVDVRVYFDENECCVPKKHSDLEIEPVAYMFVKLQRDLSCAEVTGFALSDTITKIDDVDGYYPINENSLIPFEEAEHLFKDAGDPYNVDDSEIYNMIDNKPDENAVCTRKLLKSYDGRIRLNKAYYANLHLHDVEISNAVPVAEQDNEDTLSNLLNVPESADIQEDEDDRPYNFTTVVSSNLPEESSSEYDVLEELENIAEGNPAEEFVPQVEETEVNDAASYEETEDIDSLFQEEQDANVSFKPAKKSSALPALLVILLLAALAGGGYYGYTHFMQNKPANEIAEDLPEVAEQAPAPVKQEDAMPVESVEKTPVSVAKDEGTAVSIPAIEQNLDASVIIANLRIYWEVPSGYVSNTQAQRYFRKLGKIIQLNLKTELLLLSKPPITNKISVEIKYNSSLKHFETVGIVASSGEKSVDDLVLKTIKKALDTNMNFNSDMFSKMTGNPVIIIKL